MKPTKRKYFWPLMENVVLICCAVWLLLNYNLFPTTVQPKWTFPAGGQGPLSVQSDGSLIVGARDGTVYAISPTGQELWSYDTGAQIANGVSQGKDGTIYVINWFKEFCAIDLEGKLLWKTKMDRFGTTPIITVGDDVIYVSSVGHITSFGADGTINWNHHDYSNYWKQLLITDDGRLIVGQGKGNPHEVFLMCFNPDGSIHWKSEIPDYIQGAATFLPNGNIVVPSTEGLLCYSSDGVFQWDALPEHHFESDVVVDSSGVTYCISTVKTVFAVDANGNQVWEHKLKAPGIRKFSSRVGMSLRQGSLYIGTRGSENLDPIRTYYYKVNKYKLLHYAPGILFSLSTATGKEEWHYKAPSGIYAPPAFGEDGTIYIQGLDNSLIALEPR